MPEPGPTATVAATVTANHATNPVGTAKVPAGPSPDASGGVVVAAPAPHVAPAAVVTSEGGASAGALGVRGAKKKQKQRLRLSQQQLAKLEDPTDFHVMPSSFARNKALAPSAALALVAAQAHSNMPPPARVLLPQQKILDEDDFADGIGAIVQRDFFPDLPKLKAQLAYLEASERGDTERMHQINSEYTRSMRRQLQGDSATETPTPVSTRGGSDTPGHQSGAAARRSQAGKAGGNDDDDDVAAAAAADVGDDEEEEEQEEEEEDPAAHKGGLDSWLSTHNGEDNASFEEIHEKDKAAHRARYWWVWNDDAKAGRGFQMLRDGTIVRVGGNAPSNARLALQDATGRADAGVPRAVRLALKAQADAGSAGPGTTGSGGVPHKLSSGAGMGAGGWQGDDRKGTLDMAPYRNRNHLMFQPELATSREICGLPAAAAGAGGGIGGSSTDLVAGQRRRRRGGGGDHVHKEPKEIKHAATRFVGDPDAYNEALAVVAAAADEARRARAAAGGAAGDQMGGGQYDFVSTPQIIPGETVTPLMTWGAVEGTPLILRDAAAGMTPIDLRGDPAGASSEFKIPAGGVREKVALRLEAEARDKQRRKRDRASSLRRRPASTAHDGGSGGGGAATPFDSPVVHSARAGAGATRRAAPGGSTRKKMRLLTPAQRRLSMMSPAARSLAERLARSSGGGKSPFGGGGGGMVLDAQLRANYAGGGRVRRPSSVAQGRSAATPTMSPRHSSAAAAAWRNRLTEGHKSRGDHRSRGGSGGAGGGGRGGGASAGAGGGGGTRSTHVTDNLLKL